MFKHQRERSKIYGGSRVQVQASYKLIHHAPQMIGECATARSLDTRTKSYELNDKSKEHTTPHKLVTLTVEAVVSQNGGVLIRTSGRCDE